MINSWGDNKTRRFAEQGKATGFRGLDTRRAGDRLAQLDRATSLDELRPFGSLRLHALKGDLKGFWAININARWRLIFRFDTGDAHDVRIIDYHSG